jgi:tetratricopeptide (TPR) repeat protein
MASELLGTDSFCCGSRQADTSLQARGAGSACFRDTAWLVERCLTCVDAVLASKYMGKKGGLAFVFLLFGCASFQAAGQVQSGRRALLINNPEQALAYFQQAAESNPNYVYESGLFREGIWTYVGRAQYSTGKLEEARRSLERALSVYKDDYLARIYLGLTLVRSDDRSTALKEIESGMKGLHDWLEYINTSRPFTAYWDPTREIRSELEKDLAMISGKDIDWPQLIASAEWIGQKMEDEMDKVKRDELEHYRRDEFGPRRGVSMGVGIGF